MTRPRPDRAAPQRVRWRHVEWVAERLSERDRAIVDTVNRLRLVSAAQLERLHFVDLSPHTRARTRRRVLARLIEWRVLTALQRRIGGERGGSSGLIVALDAAGRRVLQREANLAEASLPVRRADEPGGALVAHTLGVAELFVRLAELARDGGFSLEDFRAEPACWQPWPLGGWLKPDAYLLLRSTAYDDHWWLEHDTGSEHLPTIQRKLHAYLDFSQAGGEGPNQILPRVLVSVPNEARRVAIHSLIQRLTGPDESTFHVVTHDATAPYLVQVLRE